MARYGVESRVDADVRAVLLAKFTAWRGRAETMRAEALAAGEDPPAEPYTELVRALEEGEPIILTVWRIPAEARAGFDVWDEVRVESDGTLTKVGHVGPGDPDRQEIERRRP